MKPPTPMTDLHSIKSTLAQCDLEFSPLALEDVLDIDEAIDKALVDEERAIDNADKDVLDIEGAVLDVENIDHDIEGINYDVNETVLDIEDELLVVLIETQLDSLIDDAFRGHAVLS